MSSSAKCNFCNFLQTGTARHLINLFFLSFFFFIILRYPAISSTMVVLRRHIFSISLRVFLNSICWWSLTEVRVIANLFRSPGLFSVFWPILTVQSSGWCPLVLRILAFGDCSKRTNYNQYHRHLLFHSFSSLVRSKYLYPFSFFFNLYSVVLRAGKFLF